MMSLLTLLPGTDSVPGTALTYLHSLIDEPLFLRSVHQTSSTSIYLL
jgi:hypothetical protein